MIRKRWMDAVAVAAICIALLFSVSLVYLPEVFALESKEVPMEYAEKLFDKEKIMSIDILMSDEEWQDMLDHAAAEEYYCCDVVVNGVTYYNVGIRPKGNTSLSQIVSDDTTDRYSFKLEFDHYDSTQTCMGLDKLVLNNMMADATYRKEYISYDIMSYLGVETSLYSYADVSRNGETWGLYLAFEAVEESYAQRVFGSSYGELYKPESLGMGGETFSGTNAATLAYIDDDTDSYSVIFDSAVFSPSEEDKKELIEALRNISEGSRLEESMDVDAMLRYIASNTFLDNDDSYFGSMVHNYYLYEENGRLTMLPWDYNLAFGGFQSQNASELINRGIDDVVSGKLEERPMIAKLLETEEYRTQYYAWLDELVSGYFESGHFAQVMDMLDELLDSYVAEDPTAFYTYEEYKAANEMLRLFCDKRAESIRSQLDGVLAGTASEQTEETKIDTSDITVSVMGVQFGGGGHEMAEDSGEKEKGERENRQNGGFPGGEGNMPEGMQMSEGNKHQGMQMPENMDFSDRKAPGMEAESSDGTAGAWLGISAAVMAAGLLFAGFYPRSRY